MEKGNAPSNIRKVTKSYHKEFAINKYNKKMIKLTIILNNFCVDSVILLLSQVHIKITKTLTTTAIYIAFSISKRQPLIP